MGARTIPRFFGVLGIAGLTAQLGAQDTTRGALGGPRLVIDRVTVVDVERGRVLPNRRVEVNGTRVSAVDSGASHPITGARVVDGTGKFLIPGLWDLHVHALRNGRAAWMFPLFIVHGVLGIRDTGSPLDSLLRYRPAVASGEVLGPRVMGSGPLLDGPGGQWPEFTVPIATAAEGRRVVDSLVAAHVDFIKVYNLLSPEAFFAIADQARRRRVPVIGHVPFSVLALPASAAGLRSMEHLSVATACIPTLPAVMQEATTRAGQPGLTPDSIRAVWRRGQARAASAYDEATCRASATTLARNGTVVVPTLARERTWSHAYLASPAAGADPALRYVPRPVRTNWGHWRDSAVTNGSALDDTVQSAVYSAFVRMTRALRSGGVEVLTGTDTDGNDAYYYGVPGLTLHAELETLVRDVGFTPAEALRAATLGAARFLGIADSLGTIARGKAADLVLLDKNPLTDIRNAMTVRAVVANGRYFDRAALDTLLTAVERIAAEGARR